MNLWSDLRYGARAFRKSPGFTATAILTMAFGIGVTTATFSTCDALLWKPVALFQIDRLTMVLQRVPGDPNDFNTVSFADLDDIRRRNTAFEGVTWWTEGLANIVGAGGEPERVRQFLVAANFFELVGEHPALGRGFEPGEDQPGRERVVVLSDGLWRRRFGADPSIVGKSIRLDDDTFLVSGVMPAKFEFPKTAELWTPYAPAPKGRVVRDRSTVLAAGRLKAGRTVREASAEIDKIAGELAHEYPATNTDRRFLVMPAHEFLIGFYTKQYTLMLFGAVLFVLLIACANVANLQFARAIGRGREVALRTALGAGRWRLIRQLVTESMMLSAAGGAFGLLVASWSLSLIRGGMPPEVEKYVLGWREIGLDVRALAFTFAIALATGVLAGLLPAFHCSRPNLHETLKEGGRGASPGRGKHRFRAVLVSAEIALAVVLLVGASLMVRSFQTMAQGSASLEPSSLLTLRLAVTENKYRDGARQAAFYRSVLSRIRILPGVRSAIAATALPYSDHSSWRGFEVEGRPDDPAFRPAAQFQSVSANYFETLHVPLVEGRFLQDSDGPDSPLVAVISERAARRWFPGERSPVGKRIRVASDSGARWMTVAGVAGNLVHNVYERAPQPQVYVPYVQAPRTWMDVGIRAAGDPMTLRSAVTAAIRSVDPEQPITDVATMRALMQHQATGLIYVAVMMGIFGVLAMALSAIGVYGVMSYLVNQQTHEIGIRMALGAQRSAVLGMVFRRGLLTTATGMAIGLAAAYAMARLMASLIWGVTAGDPVTFAGIPVALFAAAGLAIYIPARRAVRIDPITALRYE